MNQSNPAYVQKGRECLQSLPIAERLILAFAALDSLELRTKVLATKRKMVSAVMKDQISTFPHDAQVLAQIGQHLGKYPDMPFEALYTNISLDFE